VALGLEASASLAGTPGWEERATREASRLAADLACSASATAHGAGWGYPFDWQGRAFWAPRGTPTVVCSGFVVRALDAARELLAADGALVATIEAAMRAAARFVLDDLNRTRGQTGFCWSYSPRDRSQVVNATLLGAEIVARTAVLDRRPELLQEAAPTVAWALGRQNDTGGWAYGEAGHQGWEDAFHTGFNLLSLSAIQGAAESLGLSVEPQLADGLRKGFRHYRDEFFGADGQPWYYRRGPWPADAHAAAVGVITLLRLSPLDADAVRQAQGVLNWTLAKLWDERGWFLFQSRPGSRIRIPYLRWAQAWMLLALAEHQRMSKRT
jgi:hypothetical protein